MLVRVGRCRPSAVIAPAVIGARMSRRSLNRTRVARISAASHHQASSWLTTRSRSLTCVMCARRSPSMECHTRNRWVPLSMARDAALPTEAGGHVRQSQVQTGLDVSRDRDRLRQGHGRRRQEPVRLDRRQRRRVARANDADPDQRQDDHRRRDRDQTGARTKGHGSFVAPKAPNDRARRRRCRTIVTRRRDRDRGPHRPRQCCGVRLPSMNPATNWTAARDSNTSRYQLNCATSSANA